MTGAVVKPDDRTKAQRHRERVQALIFGLRREMAERNRRREIAEVYWAEVHRWSRR